MGLKKGSPRKAEGLDNIQIETLLPQLCNRYPIKPRPKVTTAAAGGVSKDGIDHGEEVGETCYPITP